MNATSDAPSAEVRAAATLARTAASNLRDASTEAVDAALRAAARRIRERRASIRAANQEDLDDAERDGMALGMQDRLALIDNRMCEIADQLDDLADRAAHVTEEYVRDLASGDQVFQRWIPVGVMGAVFEARPNVAVDIASQALKARSATVLRAGSGARRSASVLVDDVLRPALLEAGLPPNSVQLILTQGHEAADAMVALPDLMPLVVVRGRQEVTRRLSERGARSGTRVLAHSAGGGVLICTRTPTTRRRRRS